MMNRRRALKVLGTAGIGTAVFQRALAATADDGSVTAQMVADAEWLAGITLTPAATPSFDQSSGDPVQTLPVLPRRVAASLQIVRERSEERTKTGSQDFGGADFVVEVDDLPDLPARRWIEVQALVVTAPVMREGDPAQVPPVGLNVPLRRALGVAKGAPFEQLPPVVPLLHDPLKRQQGEREKATEAAAVMESVGGTHSVGQLHA